MALQLWSTENAVEPIALQQNGPACEMSPDTINVKSQERRCKLSVRNVRCNHIRFFSVAKSLVYLNKSQTLNVHLINVIRLFF